MGPLAAERVEGLRPERPCMPMPCTFLVALKLSQAPFNPLPMELMAAVGSRLSELGGYLLIWLLASPLEAAGFGMEQRM